MAPDITMIDSFNKVGDGKPLTLLSGIKPETLRKLMEGKSDERVMTGSSLNLDGYMIPANEGKVKHLSMTCPPLGGTFGGDDPLQNNFVDALKIFAENMPDCKFTILTSRDKEAKMLKKYVKEWTKEGFIENPERINIVNSDMYLSLWAQDSTWVVGKQA